MGYVCGHRQQPSDPQHMGTAFNHAKTSPASWDAFADVDAFVDAVLAELMAGTRPTRSGPKPPLTGAALRKAILAIWCVAFCGLQHRSALRHPVQHAVHALCPLDPARAMAPAARPAAPRLAAGLRRYCGPEHRCHRQPLLPLGTELLHARHRRRQEDPRCQDPGRGRQARYPAGNRCRAGQHPRHQGHRPSAARAGRAGFPGTGFE